MTANRMRIIALKNQPSIPIEDLDLQKLQTFQDGSSSNPRFNPCQIMNLLNQAMFKGLTQLQAPVQQTPATAQFAPILSKSPLELPVPFSNEPKSSSSFDSFKYYEKEPVDKISGGYICRTVQDIAQDIVMQISACKQVIKMSNDDSKLTNQYMKLMDVSKKLSDFLQIEYMDLPTPTLVLDSICDYFKKVYKCHACATERSDIKCFSRLQALQREFVCVVGGIYEHQLQAKSVQKRLE
ncbi:Hypothetical_protein [Hexamita inflata]|uniref:Hypothetical_protein n=1 Tax=Hexamita inflata TaxID=28002 RepID=A0AA86TC93_9EUKA|nr:Hypothetical protein HINF_LOCUS1426 [Hexamita inflata]